MLTPPRKLKGVQEQYKPLRIPRSIPLEQTMSELQTQRSPS